jgi:hypothetical protein
VCLGAGGVAATLRVGEGGSLELGEGRDGLEGFKRITEALEACGVSDDDVGQALELGFATALAGGPDVEGHFRLEQDDAVRKITLNRPEVLNAMSAYDLRRLMREFLSVWRDESVGSVLLTGEGRAFTAGHDLTSDDLGAVGAGAWNDLFELMRQQPKPTVAAVNGTAVDGGLHLALTCDRSDTSAPPSC